jgi:hypothetical protein
MHNFDRFDSVYILPELLKMKEKYDLKITPLVNNGRLLEIKVTLLLNEKVPDSHKKGPRGGTPLTRVTILFRDSLKLLPASLRELGAHFSVETQKGFFPYNFMTKETLTYIGCKPDIKFYPNAAQSD